jgi:adenine C2-methylase RlmN of 23S rRNA A2503 and tRNA A37
MNHSRDEEEEWKKFEYLCRFINPQIATEVFDQKIIDKTESTEDVLFEQMSKDLKGKYTPQELKGMMEDPKHHSELDRIERV